MMKNVTGRLALLAILAGPVTISDSGCYYARAGYGQAKVLLGRESIDEVIVSDKLREEEKNKLALVPHIKTFAQDNLGLIKNDSYTEFYDTKGMPVAWNVTACETTAFNPYTWNFLFVGDAPYIGFFSLEEAREEASKISKEKYDVRIMEVEAYSTLGWFADPIFSRMLSRDICRLSNTIIHELTHATVFKQGDAQFNESVATFVGTEGALTFLASHYGQSSQEVIMARDKIADEHVFEKFVDDLYARLNVLYTSNASDARKRVERKQIFLDAQREFKNIRATKMREPAAWKWFDENTLDNASILLFKKYHSDLTVYQQVLDHCQGNFPAAIAVFREAADSDHPLDTLKNFVAAKGGVGK